MSAGTGRVRREPRSEAFGDWCGRASGTLSWWTERVCAAILAVMIADVGIGICGRYFIDIPVTWAEELARYLMIWAALLAVSCGIARREHVAVTALVGRLPPRGKRIAAVVQDGLGLALFAFIGYFGIGMAAQGGSQFASIFGMTMLIPFAAVPVSAALSCVQILLVGLRDALAAAAPPPEKAFDEAT